MKINSRKQLLTKTSLLLLFLATLSFSPQSVKATSWSGQPAQIYDLEFVFSRIVSVALGLAGLALFIMLIVGGFQYLTAGENPKNAEKAQKTLTNAVLGLIVVIGAWLILSAIHAITGLNVTVFRIPR